MESCRFCPQRGSLVVKPRILLVVLFTHLALPLSGFAEPSDETLAPHPAGEEAAPEGSEPRPFVESTEPGGSTTNTDEARRYYRHGSDLVEQGQWAKAIVAYRRSFELHAASSTLVNLAYCENRLGHLVEAWILLSQALSLSEEGTAAPLAPERRALVETERDRVKARIGSITVSGAEGTELRVDGAHIVPIAGMSLVYRLVESEGENWQEIAPGGQILVDPMQYRLHHRLHSAARSETVVVSEGQTFTLLSASPELAPDRIPPSAPLAPRVSSSQKRSPRPDDAARSRDFHPYRAPGITSLILSGVGVTSAAISLGVMLDAESRLNGICSAEHICPPGQAGAVSQFETAATIANVSMIASAGAAVLGVSLLLLDGAHSKKQIALHATPRMLGIQGKF